MCPQLVFTLLVFLLHVASFKTFEILHCIPYPAVLSIHRTNLITTDREEQKQTNWNVIAECLTVRDLTLFEQIV